MASNNMKSRYLLEHLTLSTSQLLCQVHSVITKPRDAALPFRYDSQYSSTDRYQIISEMLQLFTIWFVPPLLIHLHSLGRKTKSALTCLFSSMPAKITPSRFWSLQAESVDPSYFYVTWLHINPSKSNQVRLLTVSTPPSVNPTHRDIWVFLTSYTI